MLLRICAFQTHYYRNMSAGSLFWALIFDARFWQRYACFKGHMHKPSAPPPYGFIRGKEEHLKLRRRMRLLSVISCFISQVWHPTIPNAEDVDSVVNRETSDCFYLLTPAAYCSILLPLSRSQLNLHFHSAKQSIISSNCCMLTLSLSWPWTELLSHIAC